MSGRRGRGESTLGPIAVPKKSQKVIRAAKDELIINTSMFKERKKNVLMSIDICPLVPAGVMYFVAAFYCGHCERWHGKPGGKG